MQSVTHPRATACKIATGLVARRPLRLHTKARLTATVTERGRCGRRVHTQQPSAYAAQQPTQEKREQLALTVRPQPFVLSRSQLANKQVVSRTTGVILGVVDDLIANTSTCKVEAVSLSKTKDALPGEEKQQIGLMSLKQISDVLLVHDERALLRQQLTIGMGCIQLIGKAVKTADGRLVGKVRDFDFCPDDGRITQLVVDALGIPAVPRRLLACLGIRIQLVSNATWSGLTLYPGAEAQVEKLSTGLFDSAVGLLKKSVPFLSLLEGGDEEVDQDPEYTKWWLEHGERYEQINGTRMRRPSEAAIQAALAARRQQQPPQAPQALPPGRQATYASQLQPQASFSAKQLQPEYATWQQPSNARQAQQAQQQRQNGSSSWQQMPQQAPQPTQQGWLEGPSSIRQQQPQSLSFPQSTPQQQGSAGQQPWPDAQPGSSPPGQQWQDSGLQYTGAAGQSTSPMSLQHPGQQQWQQAQQRDWSAGQQLDWSAGQQQQQQQQSGMNQPGSLAGSAQKVEQRRRIAARQGAGIEEPRSDPRRRRPATASLRPSSDAPQSGYTEPNGQKTFAARPRSSVQPGYVPDNGAGSSDRSPGMSFPQQSASSSEVQLNGLTGQAAQATASGLAAKRTSDKEGYGKKQQGQNSNRQSQRQEASGMQSNQAYDGWAQSSPGAPIDTVAISSDGSYDTRGSFDVA